MFQSGEGTVKKVYVDNSSTSFPKANGVSDAMKGFLDNNGCNVGRGGYADSYAVAMEVVEARQALADLFHVQNAQQVVFTPGLTYSLNMLLQGFLKPGDHVITTSMEHNAVMRPLHALAKRGVDYDTVMCDEAGRLDPDAIVPLVTARTKAVVMLHASNVCGTVLPIEAVTDICRQRGLRFIVDAAQTAGVWDIDAGRIDAVAFAGHKGLLGPQGIGGFVLQKDFADELTPLIFGGTGSFSHELEQPGCLPDAFESGTLNIPGIIGLKAALAYVKAIGISTIRATEERLTTRFIEGVGTLDGVRIVGCLDSSERVAVVSLDFVDNDNALIAGALDCDYGIMTRCGLHCSPSAHKTLGTYPGGTVRFSFGHKNTEAEVDYIVQSLGEILKRF